MTSDSCYRNRSIVNKTVNRMPLRLKGVLEFAARSEMRDSACFDLDLLASLGIDALARFSLSD